MSRWPFVVAPVVVFVLFLVSMIVFVSDHTSMGLEAIVGSTFHWLVLPFAATALAALWCAIGAGPDAARRLVVAVAAVLSTAILFGGGVSWGFPLALVGCAAILVLPQLCRAAAVPPPEPPQSAD